MDHRTFRFFEAKVEYDYVLDPATNETVNYTVIGPLPTDLRTHPIYTAYFNWSRLVVLGIIPFVLLVYLNTKIYQVCLSAACAHMGKCHKAAIITLYLTPNLQVQRK